MLDFVKVESSSLDAIKHEPVTNELLILFKSGQLYKYQNVSTIEYDSLMKAESIGKWFHAHIRMNKPYEKFSF